MRAVRARGMDFRANFDKQDLSAFDAFDFDFLLLSIPEVEGADTLQFEFGGHSSVDNAEACRLSVEWFDWSIGPDCSAN